MMADRREEILARSFIIIQTKVTGLKKSFRNNIEHSESDLPLMVLLDGDEKAESPDMMDNRGPKVARSMIMTPQFMIIVSQSLADVGSLLNEFRGKLIHEMTHDDELTALTKNSIGVRVITTQTNFAWGRSMTGEMGVGFAIPYMLQPTGLSYATA